MDLIAKLKTARQIQSAQSTGLLKNVGKISALPLLVALATTGCSHSIDPVAISSTANPVQEVNDFDRDMGAAQAHQTDVLAPQSFDDAKKYLDEAKYRRSKTEAGSRVLESVSYGRAYLNQAEQKAKANQVEMQNVIDARQLALTAGANQLESDIAPVDGRFRKEASRLEDGKKVGVDTLAKLQQDYLDLELKAMKAKKLGEARHSIAVAEKEEASRITPRSYADALQKVSNAEKVIETDRHNDTAVNTAVNEANAASAHLIAILDKARSTQDKPLEAIALELDKKDEALTQKDSQVQDLTSEVMKRQQALGKTHGELATLEEQAQMDKAFQDAQAKFSHDEAEVYRQGNKLIVRLKSIDFSSGRADIPPNSLTTLNKVKDVIKNLNASSVVVEGHTDGVGPVDLNQKLSEKRADGVKHFLVEADAAPEDRIRAVGENFQKPLASNKSKVGRRQNRRVDVIIEANASSEEATRTEKE